MSSSAGVKVSRNGLSFRVSSAEEAAAYDDVTEGMYSSLSAHPSAGMSTNAAAAAAAAAAETARNNAASAGGAADAVDCDVADGWDWAQGSSTVGAPPKRTLNSLGVPDSLWRHFQTLSNLSLREMEPTDKRYKELPPKYHSAFCLDSGDGGGNYGGAGGPSPSSGGGGGGGGGSSSSSSGSSPSFGQNASGSFGYPSVLYKVVSSEDSLPYALRRFDNVKCSHKVASAALDAWRRVRHPGVVRLHRCFVLQRALFFVHEHYPGATTLKERYIDRRGPLLQERLLWSYVCQAGAALRAIHGAQLACRSLKATHVLRTSGGRLRIGCVGVADVLEFEARKQLGELQKEDVASLGRLVLSLATRSMVDDKTDANTLSNCVAFVAMNYTQELHELTVSLLTEPLLSIFDVCGMMAGHMIDELDMAHGMSDAYESQLLNEFESGRSLRLLMKLGFVNERPEYGVDKQWSETGDRYVLKLFRDYVFHQADEAGNPVLDVGHVVSSLNKLDAGDSEKVVLASRDGQALLVVSFADVARCLESAYDELLAKNAAVAGGGGGGGAAGATTTGGGGGGGMMQGGQVVNELSFGMMGMGVGGGGAMGGGGRGYY